MQRLLDLLPVVQLESDADVNQNVEVDARTALVPELSKDWNFSKDPTPASLVSLRMEVGPFSLLAYTCNTINLVPWSLTTKTSEIILFNCDGDGGNICVLWPGLGLQNRYKVGS